MRGADRVQRAWYGDGRRHYPLVPLSLLFQGLAALRRRLYLRGVLARRKAQVPVLVVGNLSVGGTGKTPLVIYLVERLQRFGARPGVVSRGYGGRGGRAPRLVQPDDDAAVCGDEPLLIRRRTGAPVAVSPDRAAAVARLAAEGVDIVISDDGLQHYRMERDAEIVVIDGARGLGNGWCLPAGPLREPAARLAQADLVVINGDGFELEGALRMQLAPEPARNLRTGELRPLEAFAGERVHAVAGLGNPGRFFRALEAAGLSILEYPVPDHAAGAAYRFLDTLGGPVLLTEKDAVKCVPGRGPEIWAVPVRARFAALEAARIDALLRNCLQRTAETSC